MSSFKSQLVEGVDYYMDGTRFVFTEAYHLKRGHCCNSKCRHCPYRGAGPGAPGSRGPQISLAINGAKIDLPTIRIKPPTGGG